MNYTIRPVRLSPCGRSCVPVESPRSPGGLENVTGAGVLTAMKTEPPKRDRKAYQAVYRAKNKDKLKAHQAAWRSSNPDKLKAYIYPRSKEKARLRAAAWYSANKERAKITRAAYILSNKEKVKAVKKAYYVANIDKVKASVAEWKSINRGKVNAWKTAWHAANKEKAKAYYEANREKKTTYQSAYSRAHPEIGRNMDHRRRAQKLNCKHPATSAEIRALLASAIRCAYCSNPFKKTLRKTVDHIMPLKLGGAHELSNLTVCCRPCNSKKNASHPDEWARRLGMLFIA